MATNPTHYGNPSTGCESDEVAVRVSGLSGDFCSPRCDSQGTCPSDVPKGDTANPECALRTTTGDKYCGLICQADSDCGAIPAASSDFGFCKLPFEGALYAMQCSRGTGSCQKAMGIGLCTYTASVDQTVEQVGLSTFGLHMMAPVQLHGARLSKGARGNALQC